MHASTDPKQRIIKSLFNAPNFALRWGELKDETRLSSRTLSKHLKDLQSEKKIVRIVDVITEEYPPPVYYELIGEVEKRLAKAVSEDWEKTIESINKLAKLTSEHPELYMDTVFESLLWDSIFTIYHMAKVHPELLMASGLLAWHTSVHNKLIIKVAKYCAQNEPFMVELEKMYKNFREHIAEKEKHGIPLDAEKLEAPKPKHQGA